MPTLHRAPVVLPICAPPIRDGAVEVDGDRITWVGPTAEYRGAAEPHDWPGLLTPGLVNAHAHLQYTAFADMCDPGTDFVEWIAQFPARRREMTERDWAASARAGIAELVRTGTTCVADVTDNAAVADVAAAARLAGVTYFEAIAVDARDWPDIAQSLHALLDGADGHRHVGVSPHAVYSLSLSAVAGCRDLARARNVRLHTHAAESTYETEYVATGGGVIAEAMTGFGFDMELVRSGGSGRSPVAELDACGALGPDCHIAHGVHVDAADRELLRDRSSVVALCPRSNAVLSAGEAPVAAYRAEGNLVAVGTDSRASAPSLDLLDDVAALRDLAIGQGSPEQGLDRWLVEAATIGGAAAMGLDDVGVLRPGARADLAIFDVDVSGNPYTAVAHAAGRCAGTLLAGAEADW